MKVKLFRASKSIDPEKVYKPHDTRRQPGNVPYLVDNLWEWTRPEGYPNRRCSKYASPNITQAIESSRADDPEVGRVEFQGEHTVAQLQPEKIDQGDVVDAADHPDCSNLKYEIRKVLDRDIKRYWWATQNMCQKHPAGRLFYPCLTKSEVERLFQNVEVLEESREEIRGAVKFWKHVEILSEDNKPNERGELFFEYPGGFKLSPVDI